MPFQLELRHEGLNYTGHFARPALDLWGRGGIIVQGMLDVFGPHGVTLQQIQISNSLQNASETVMTALVPGAGQVKFGFDKVEFRFVGFSQSFFEAIPKTMNDLVAWLRENSTDFHFASHNFFYFAHSFVKDSTPQEALREVNTRDLKTAGVSIGNGAIFNYTVPGKNWDAQLLVDKSRQLAGGLFISLELQIHTGDIDYGQVLLDGRTYLANALAELNLAIPEVSE